MTYLRRLPTSSPDSPLALTGFLIVFLAVGGCSNDQPAGSSRGGAGGASDSSGGHIGSGSGGSSSTGGTKGTGGGGGVFGTGGVGNVGSGGSGVRDGGASDLANSGGDARVDAMDGAASDASKSAAFAAVQAIFASRCVGCHDPARPVVPETLTFVAMDLTAAGAYASLVNKAAAETCGGVRVVPGDPARSYLYHKVADAVPCNGGRMPGRGMLAIQPQLSAPEIATIAGWISGGARP